MIIIKFNCAVVPYISPSSDAPRDFAQERCALGPKAPNIYI